MDYKPRRGWLLFFFFINLTGCLLTAYWFLFTDIGSDRFRHFLRFILFVIFLINTISDGRKYFKSK